MFEEGRPAHFTFLILLYRLYMLSLLIARLTRWAFFKNGIGHNFDICLQAKSETDMFGSCPDSVTLLPASIFQVLSKGREKETIYTTHLQLKSQFVHTQTLPSI